MSEKLKPCPFCDGEATLDDWRYGYEDGTSIICKECGASIHEGVEDGNGWHERAVMNWNRRASEVSSAPATHANRIRSMGDEELAATLMCPNEMGMADIPCDHSDSKNCCACLLDWLRQPEED